MRTFLLSCCGVVAALCSAALSPAADAVIRVGMIGLDTSHVAAFTKVLNDPKAEGDLAGVKVVAAFPGGSPDIPSSADRVGKFTEQLQASGVEIVDSIPKLLEKVDVVMLESVDGRPHLEQARPVLAARKPMFIDKPCAGTLADVIAIFELAKKYECPIFSCSSLRFGPTLQAALKDPKVGEIRGCDAFSPCSLEEHHPDLFWYGVHGCEMLFTVMGPGVKSVTRVQTKGTELVVGVWEDGRVGTFRGIRDGKAGYGATIFGTKGTFIVDKYEGYAPMLVEACKFFRTRKPPVAAEDTINIFAFMEAADESKRQGGAPVSVDAVLEKAKAEAAKKL